MIWVSYATVSREVLAKIERVQVQVTPRHWVIMTVGPRLSPWYSLVLIFCTGNDEPMPVEGKIHSVQQYYWPLSLIYNP